MFPFFAFSCFRLCEPSGREIIARSASLRKTNITIFSAISLPGRLLNVADKSEHYFLFRLLFWFSSSRKLVTEGRSDEDEEVDMEGEKEDI